jgi:hypothetical protein
VTVSEEFEHIKAAIYDNPRSDPGRLETCLSIALEALGEIAGRRMPAEFHAPTDEALQAMAALRRMEMRVRLGDDQPPNSDLSLHWPDVPRDELVLDEQERHGW